MRAAVIGGGVFGTLAAIELVRAGMYVDLYEAKSDILMGATAHNQARLHSGYHYPRSKATAVASRDAAVAFEARFPQAVRHYRHHYVVAEGSKVSPDDYLTFCHEMALPYKQVKHSAVARNAMCVEVPEALINVPLLRRLIRTELLRPGTAIHTGRRIDPANLDHDLIVMATYGRPWLRPLRYEVCEVALVELGRISRDDSFVVVDGPFISLDPARYGHMLYDVTHSVHHANVGLVPEVPDEYQPLLDRGGPIMTPLSHFDAMMDTASEHLRGISQFGRGVTIHQGSLFTVRAVLPDVDATDERPTLVERDGDGNVLWILSGKIGTAVTTARRVAELAMVTM